MNNMEDTAETDRGSLVKQHMLDWKAWQLKFGSIDNCNEPRIVAGCFLAWAGGSLNRAISAMQAHCSGKYQDMPPFPGCQETLSYLQDLKQLVEV